MEYANYMPDWHKKRKFWIIYKLLLENKLG